MGWQDGDGLPYSMRAPGPIRAHAPIPGCRMLQRICIGLIVFLFFRQSALGATLAEQALPVSWSTASCSPCIFTGAPASFTTSRMFASFELDAAGLLESASVPALNNALGYLGDISVSIWSSQIGRAHV